MTQVVEEQPPRLDDYKIVLVGRSGGGKSALTLRFVYNIFEKVSPTPQPQKFKKNVALDGREVSINILDTPGRDINLSVRDTYFRAGEGIVIVFSITDEHSFEAAQKLWDHINRVSDVKNKPIMLIGNKCDMEDSRRVTKEEILKKAKKWNVPYLETSAKSGENVEKAFLDMARLIANRSYPTETSSSRPCCEIL